MSWKNKIVLISCFGALLTLFAQRGLAAEPSMATYTAYPIFQLNTVAPNILIILDNSASMNEQAYDGPYDHSIAYYGYFESYKKYRYGSNIFVRDPGGPWDGNFLNWLTMRKIDVARKVLMGGLATSRMGTGNQTNIGEAPSIVGYDFIKSYTDTVADDVTPFDETTTFSYLMDGGNFYVNAGVYVIKVDKDMNTYPDEAPSFVDGNIAGVLQKIGDKARWGNMFFNYGTGHNGSGGSVLSTIGTNMTSLITDLQNTSCNTWTPLAEALYVATQYFKQEDPEANLEYPTGAAPNSNVGDDPYYNGVEYVHCAKSFVLLLTDGMSTMDMLIPGALKDFDGDSNDPGSFPDSGSDYLDDVAYYARTTDLRSPTVGKTDLDGEQNLILYTVYAFGNDPNAETLLKDASKNGGFVEKNGIPGPDLQAEWDADNDGDPDTYYKADTGYQLEGKILAAINDILARAASGTAVSVLASSSEGEGNLVQAYYRPAITQGITEYKWLGYLQSLWVDPMGNLREDTNQNRQLDLDVDKPLKYFHDPGTGDTMLKRYDAAQDPDFQNGSYELVQLDEVAPLWEAGSNLAQMTSAERKIFTFVDKNGDGLVDESVHNDPFDKFGEIIGFDTINDSCGMGKNCIRPYLGVKDDATWGYLGADHDTRIDNLINYIRGEDIPGLRPRVKDAMNNVWKLADIVNSTPVSVNRPVENYHIIYSDESYQAYLNASLNRETIVYVGANDGMLHAFTSWEYDAVNMIFNKPAAAPGTESMGDEIWAYIPQVLLPHLNWFPSPNYTHVYYADLKPKVFDAKILPDDTYYVDADSDDNWGTFLLLGLNMGGKYIPVTDDFDYDAGTPDTTRDFYPTYTLLNVTDPRNPELIWERTYTDLELSTSFPAIVRVKDKWFAVFGSGPSDYDGLSNKKGHVFVVDLKTGNPYGSGGNDWLFETGESNAFMSPPISLDEGLNFSVDAIYFGETYLSGSWKGKMYKLTVPWVDASGNYDGVNLANYVDNPLDAMYPWQFAPLYNATRPITAPVSVSRDTYNNIWIFGGTGRYLSPADKTDTDTQYIFGVKDPFYNIEHTPAGLHADDYYLNYTASLELSMSDLLNTDEYVVTTGDEVFDAGGTSIGNFEAMKDLVYVQDGWVRTLSLSKERIIQKPSLLGGMVYVPSFVPNGDVCGYGGDSYLYGLYYETGTAYIEPGFANNGTTTVDINGQPVDQVVDKTSLGYGKASSLGIHVGQEEGAKGYIQQSTGTVHNEDLNPALNIKSGLRCWREK